MRIIVDTGFFIASINDRDQHHHWAKQITQEYKPPFIPAKPLLPKLHTCSTKNLVQKELRY